MAGNEPFDQLAGITLDVYIAPVGTAVADPDSALSGSFVLLGATDGEQRFERRGALTYFYDNEHQGPVKAVRPQEDPTFIFNLVELTLENMGRLLDTAADVVTSGSTKTLPTKRGRFPTEYCMVMRSSVLSPYGSFEGQYVIPRGVFDGEPQEAYTRDGRPGMEVEFHALEDDDQSDANSLGWLEVMTA